MTVQAEWLPALAVVHRLARRYGRTVRVAVAVDADLAAHPIVTRAVNITQANNGEPTVHLVEPAAGIGAVETLAAELESAELVFAIGGGSLIDLCKISTLTIGNPRLTGTLTVPQRSGIAVVPDGVTRISPLIAVPTTLGTGTESSEVAVFDTGGTRRLLIGLALRPDERVLDALATSGLPDHLLVEGLLEILSRLVSPYVGDQQDRSTTDALAEALAGQVVRLGDQVAAAIRAGDEPSDRLRLEIARVSAISHSDWLVRDGDPYTVKGWLVAMELAQACGVRKMTATAALWPHLWSRVAGPDHRWGSATRLHRMWELIRSAHDRDLPQDPAAGIAELIENWSVETFISPTLISRSAVAETVNRKWGAGMPMLGGLNLTDIRSLVGDVASSSATQTTAARICG